MEQVGLVSTRWSRASDAERLAELYRDAWRHAYAGIISGPVLERMVARRGVRWWERLHARGSGALLVEFGGEVVGYATLGPCRGPVRGAGEIYEIYLRPEFQGVGLGRRLFEEARRRLRADGREKLVIWSLAENEIGCRFYRAMGGQQRSWRRMLDGDARVEVVAFTWGARGPEP